MLNFRRRLFCRWSRARLYSSTTWVSPSSTNDDALLIASFQLQRTFLLSRPPILILTRRSAHDVAQSRQHKSISASDVLRALELLEFADLSVRLQPELQSKIPPMILIRADFYVSVYRDMQKAEPSKSKKGANGSASVAKKATASSASASGVSKGKGKERLNPQGNPLPPPFTSTPLESSGPHEGAVESISGTGIAMDVDDENADVEEVDEEVEEVDDIVEETEEGIAVDQGTSDEEKELVGEALEEQIPADDKD